MARTYHRDARGRFATSGSSTDAKRKKRRRVAVGSAVAVGVAATQARKTSRTRTGIARRKIVRKHVGRARADHARNVSRRNRVFPTSALGHSPFDKKAARREGRSLTKGHHGKVRAVRKRLRKR